MTTGLSEPLPRALERVLRDLVVAQARRPDGQVSSVTLHVGIPGRAERSLPLDASRLDHALRVEIIEAMAHRALRRDLVPLVWLTRPPEEADLDDLAWAAAAAAAGAELGVRLDLVVVTRRSWADPRSGTGRTWRRLRSTATAEESEVRAEE